MNALIKGGAHSHAIRALGLPEPPDHTEDNQ